MIRCNFNLRNQQHKDLKKLTKGMSISEHIRTAIDEYLEKNRKRNSETSTSESISQIIGINKHEIEGI